MGTRFISDSFNEDWREWTNEDHQILDHEKYVDKDLMAKMVELWSPNSMIDLGAGIGAYCKLALELGLEEKVTGVEVSRDINDISLIPLEVADLQEDVDFGRYDIVLCLEVAEHVKHSTSATLVANCTRHSDRVIFSAAPPGQMGDDHINCQPWEFWEGLFVARGFIENHSGTESIREASQISWIKNNVHVLVNTLNQ